MGKLIDLDKAISAIRADKIHITSGLLGVGAKPEVCEAINAACDRHVRMLEEMDGQRGKIIGKWNVYYRGNNDFSYSCNCCGHSAPFDMKAGEVFQWRWNFCPNCGADLRPEQTRSQYRRMKEQRGEQDE